jgi:hypothetical protein
MNGRVISSRFMIDSLVQRHGVTWAGWYNRANLERIWHEHVPVPRSQFALDAWDKARTADWKRSAR